MKITGFRTISVLTIFCCLTLLQGCMLIVSDLEVNDEIDIETRERIDFISTAIIDCINTKNASGINSFLSPPLMEKLGGNPNAFLNNFKDYQFTGKLIPIDAYRVVNASSNPEINLTSPEKSSIDYTLKFTCDAKEMYAATYGMEVGAVTYSFIIIYVHLNNDWKVHILHANALGIERKLAADLYEKAKALFVKENYVDAFFNMVLCLKVAKPFGAYGTLQDETNYSQFYQVCLDEVNKKLTLPLDIGDISPGCKILSASVDIFEEGAFPTIGYLSRIELSDTAALKKENLLIQAEINTIFRGITENNRAVRYNISNYVREGDLPVASFIILQDTGVQQ